MSVYLTDPAQLQGANVVGRDGGKLGEVEAVYFDDVTNRPEWAAVKSGFLGRKISLVPLANAEFDGVTLTVPYAKTQLEQAPRHDPGKELSPEDEADLFAYYGVADDRRTASRPTTNDAMTRSEERLRVGTEQIAAGKARLRKHVVTEHQQVTVPVSHEELRVDREPITEANRGEALDDPPISEKEQEVTLHAERVVVDKEVEPVERVRLGTDTVTEQQEVGGEVRKEVIEIDDEDRRS